MTNEIVKHGEMSIDDLQRTASLLVASGYFDTRGDSKTQIAQLATKILAGREMGYGSFASAQGIHIIQGKPTVSANLMAAAVKAHPCYDYRVRKMSADEVSIEFFQKGESLGVSSFTMEEASAAKLNGKDNWKKFPKNMLFARAMSNGVRWYCPDVFSGNSVYTPDELGGDEEIVSDDSSATYTVVDDNAAHSDTSAVDVDSITIDNAKEDASATVQDEPERKPKATKEQKAKLALLGQTQYGDDWKQKSKELCQSVSKGAVNSIDELLAIEVEKLINGLQNLVNADAQPEPSAV